MNNYFDLENPDDWLCSVERMGLFNPALNIRMYNPNDGETLIASFLLPSYIRCPMQWKGANFRLASFDEQKEFAEIFGIEDPNRVKNLFVCDYTNSLEQIQILAMRGRIGE